MPWPKKQVIQFDPDTDLRIYWGGLLCLIDSCGL